MKTVVGLARFLVCRFANESLCLLCFAVEHSARDTRTQTHTHTHTYTHIQTLRNIDALHTQQSPIDNAMAVSFVCCYCALSRWQAMNDWKNLHYFLIVQGLSQLIATRLTGSMSDVKIVFGFQFHFQLIDVDFWHSAEPAQNSQVNFVSRDGKSNKRLCAFFWMWLATFVSRGKGRSIYFSGNKSELVTLILARGPNWRSLWCTLYFAQENHSSTMHRPKNDNSENIGHTKMNRVPKIRQREGERRWIVTNSSLVQIVLNQI